MSYDYCAIAKDVLASSQEKDYKGHDKFDALNSPFLKCMSFGSQWLRFLYTQAVCRCPVNIRPLLGVVPGLNPKGVALFCRAYLLLYKATGSSQYLEECTRLLELLNAHKCAGQNHTCWGYDHIWQSVPPFVQFPGTPNLVTTVFVGEALIHAFRVYGRQEYLDAAFDSALFIMRDLPVLAETDAEKAVGYILGKQSRIVLNVQVLAGAFLAKVWTHAHEKELLETATKLLNFTVRRRTEFYSWDYSYPIERFHGVDNYHTGGIVDGLLEYSEETGDQRFQETYWKALEYYRDALFEPDGAPRWMNNRKYPHDVHGAAQGIISFAKAAHHRQEYRGMARKVADWSIEHLYRPKTRDFRYRRSRYFGWNFSLMRWCNAWMARALAECVAAEQ